MSFKYVPRLCCSFLLLANAFDFSEFKISKGYEIEVLVQGLDAVRSMTLSSSSNILYAGSFGQFTGRKVHKVYAVDLTSKTWEVAWQGSNHPNGVAWHEGSLYIAEVDKIHICKDVDQHVLDGKLPVTDCEVFVANLPSDIHHGWKYIKMSPDGQLFLQQGAPCNTCTVDPPYGTISYYPKGSKTLTTWATGIRNSVGFAWHPQSGKLLFTNNARDWYGDDRPDDHLSIAPKGSHHGFPECHFEGTGPPLLRSAGPPKFLDDDSYGTCSGSASPIQKPVQALGPHVAALGMTFWRDMVVIAEHGSWNRKSKIGYRIAYVKIDAEGRSLEHGVLACGWLNSRTGGVTGRPVDVIEAPDGSLLVSDDKSDQIYRIHGTGPLQHANCDGVEVSSSVGEDPNAEHIASAPDGSDNAASSAPSPSPEANAGSVSHAILCSPHLGLQLMAVLLTWSSAFSDNLQ